MTTALSIQTERDFESAVYAWARLRGWRCYHPRPARIRDEGWRTALRGDTGWPDWVFVREGRMVVLELKSMRGKATREQREWIRELAEVPGVVARVVTPAGWDWVEQALR